MGPQVLCRCYSSAAMTYGVEVQCVRPQHTQKMCNTNYILIFFKIINCNKHMD